MRVTNYTEGHYAYTHSGPDGLVFYVGKGKGRRAHALLCRPAMHQQRINAIGRAKVIVTIYHAPTDRDACVMEQEMIDRLSAEGAPLCNAPVHKRETTSRDPDYRGQGRKPLSPTGELMKSRQVRMTEAQWSDARFLGMQSIRDFVTRRAAFLRKAKEPTP